MAVAGIGNRERSRVICMLSECDRIAIQHAFCQKSGTMNGRGPCVDTTVLRNAPTPTSLPDTFLFSATPAPCANHPPSIMSVHPDSIASCVLDTFDKLPERRKPRPRGDGSKEWIPLAGIVLVKGTVTAYSI
jgi:hypothetical protein